MPDAIRDRIAIVVASRDRYSELWDTFFHGPRRGWPDCPPAAYLVTNTLDGGGPGVIGVPVGPDQGWSTNLLRALSSVPAPYVPLLLEDPLLQERVDHAETMRAFGRTVDSAVNCLKLNPPPPPDRPHDRVTRIVWPGFHYRVSTVATLGRKTMRTQLLRAGETAWDFELRGTARSDAFGGFCASWQPHLPVANAGVRGCWPPAALRRAAKLGDPIDPKARHAMGRTARPRHLCALARGGAMAMLPAPARRAVRALFPDCARLDSAPGRRRTDRSIVA